MNDRPTAQNAAAIQHGHTLEFNWNGGVVVRFDVIDRRSANLASIDSLMFCHSIAIVFYKKRTTRFAFDVVQWKFGRIDRVVNAGADFFAHHANHAADFLFVVVPYFK